MNRKQPTQLDARDVEYWGKLLYDSFGIPKKMPILKSNGLKYVLVAILSNSSQKYAQLIEDKAFYQRQLHLSQQSQYFHISGLYSIHELVIRESVKLFNHPQK